MPVANCFIRDRVAAGAEIRALTGLWAKESGISDQHMTINVIAETRQSGVGYPVMAFLYLPSLWSPEHVRRLQVGLASALAHGFAVRLADVQVITSIVASGHVVEDGEIQEW